MVCSKCGVNNDKASSFCTACGTPLVTNNSNKNQNKKENENGAAERTAKIPQTNPTKKKSNKRLIGIIIAVSAALLILISIIIIIAIQPKKVDVEEFVEINYSGYDGYGTASVSLDRDGLYDAIIEAKGDKKLKNIY